MKATNGKETTSQKKTVDHDEGGASPSVVGEEHPSAVALALEHRQSLLVMFNELDALLHGCHRGLFPRHVDNVLEAEIDGVSAALQASDPAAGHEDEDKPHVGTKRVRQYKNKVRGRNNI